MKPSGSVIFGTNMIWETWSASQGSIEEATRQGGAPTPPGRALHSCEPLKAPPTDFFRLYIYIYQYTLKPSGNRIDWEFRRRKPP